MQTEGPLIASGTLEADEILVGFEVPGRIVELAQEGQIVMADETVAKLDDALIQVQIMQANLARASNSRSSRALCAALADIGRGNAWLCMQAR